MRVLRAPPAMQRQRRFRPITRIQHRTTNAWGSALLWMIAFTFGSGAFVYVMMYIHKHYV